MKNILMLVLISIFIFSTIGAYAANASASPLDEPTANQPMEKTKDRASRAMNNIFYGTVEGPDNLNQTNTKGTAVANCTPKTKTGVERGIARVVTGVWQLATFWYSDPGCVTSSGGASSGNVKTSGNIK